MDHEGAERVGEYVRMHRRGTTWHANLQHGGKQIRKSLKTTNKKLALRRALVLERELVTGTYQHPRQAAKLQTTSDQYLAHLRTRGRAKRTLAKYANCFRVLSDVANQRHVQRLAGVDLAFIDIFRERRAKDGAGPTTVFKDVVTIRQLMRFAVRRKLIARDPLDGIENQRPKRRPQPFWTWEEVERILAALKSPFREPITLLALTGARFGEMQHLSWDDVELDGKRPYLKIQGKDDWKPKSGDARVIPLSDRAVALLRSIPRNHRWVFTARVTARHPQAGRQVSERRLLAYLKRVLKALGLQGHLHTLRHSFISYALVQGIPEAVLREWVGHVDREILRWYTHIADSASHEAMQRLLPGATSPPIDETT